MSIKNKLAKKSLSKKGFVQENRDHIFYFYYHQGRKTRCFTYISHGSGNDEIPDSIIPRMKRELNFDFDRQVKELLQCPMDESQLQEILRDKEII